MLRSLTLPDGNFVRPGTILGDILQYNAARSSTTSKLAQTSDTAVENIEGGSKYNIFICFSLINKICTSQEINCFVRSKGVSENFV
jgi:hypothetical protein